MNTTGKPEAVLDARRVAGVRRHSCAQMLPHGAAAGGSSRPPVVQNFYDTQGLTPETRSPR